MEFLRASLPGFLLVVIAIFLGGCVTNKPLFDSEDQIQSMHDSLELNCFIRADNMIENQIRALNFFRKDVESCFKQLISRIKTVFPDDPEFGPFKKKPMFILQKDGGYAHIQKGLLINETNWLNFKLNINEKDFKEEISHPVAFLSPIAKNVIEERYVKEQKALLIEHIKYLKKTIKDIKESGEPYEYIRM